MHTRRVRIAKLILLALLGASACSDAATPTTEEPAAATNVNAAAAASPSARREVTGDPVDERNIERSKGERFMVLIRKKPCPECDRLAGEMDALRGEGQARTLFFILDLGDAQTQGNARKLSVSLENRTDKLPWAAVFGPGGSTPNTSVAWDVNTRDFHEAVLRLKNELAAGAPPAAKAGSPLDAEEVSRLADERIQAKLTDIKAQLLQDAEFRSALLGDKGFRDELAKDGEFQASLVADENFTKSLAQSATFRAHLPRAAADNVGAKTVVSYAILGLFPLAALGLGGWAFWKTRGLLRRESKRAAVRRGRSPKRLRLLRKLVETSKSDAPLREQVAAIDKNVAGVAEQTAALRGDVDAGREKLGTLENTLAALRNPPKDELDRAAQAAKAGVERVVDEKVAGLTQDFNLRLENLEKAKPAPESVQPPASVVSREEFESVRMEVTKVRADFDELNRRKEVFSNVPPDEVENLAVWNESPAPGHAEAGAPDALSLPAAALTEAGGLNGLEERLHNLDESLGTLADLGRRVESLEQTPAPPPPGLEELRREVSSLGEQLQKERGPDAQAVAGRVESLEKQAADAQQRSTRFEGELRGMLKEDALRAAASLVALEERLSGLLKQQGRAEEEARARFSERLGGLESLAVELRRMLDEVRGDAAVTARGVAETVRRLVNAQAARLAAKLPADDEERAKAAASLERHQKPLREIVNTVAPLVQSMHALTSRTAGACKLPPELNHSLREFLDRVEHYGELERQADEVVGALRSDSARRRYEEFRHAWEELGRRADGGDVSPDQFTDAGLGLLDRYFTDRADDARVVLPPAVVEEEVSDCVSGVEERLMDWFSDFYQLHTQLQDAHGAGAHVDEKVLQGTAHALRAAREALGRFDIQPEEIQIGRTQYDRRLHDFILTRQSPHPTHTIIEVRRCGFRRMRDGETLRRPQVVVAGTGVVAGTL